jgi:hypothetical protein
MSQTRHEEKVLSAGKGPLLEERLSREVKLDGGAFHWFGLKSWSNFGGLLAAPKDVKVQLSSAWDKVVIVPNLEILPVAGSTFVADWAGDPGDEAVVRVDLDEAATIPSAPNAVEHVHPAKFDIRQHRVVAVVHTKRALTRFPLIRAVLVSVDAP